MLRVDWINRQITPTSEISFANYLETKLETICSVLHYNSYPESIINVSIRQKTARVNSKLIKALSKRCPVYQKLFLSKQNFS